MKFNRAVIGVGSNIDPEENIKKAKEAIASEFKLIGASSFIRTEPVEFKNQPMFVNGAVLIETVIDYAELKARLIDLEIKLGRVRTGNKNGPRIIDLDILVWNGDIVDRDVYEREFLAESVKELLPELDLR
ncbi:MAG: 2-amino-4-hydroxy-6-hydroxymethyldihydropteridine diphosphokinase [Deltaproteobacteria bacterium]